MTKTTQRPRTSATERAATPPATAPASSPPASVDGLLSDYRAALPIKEPTARQAKLLALNTRARVLDEELANEQQELEAGADDALVESLEAHEANEARRAEIQTARAALSQLCKRIADQLRKAADATIDEDVRKKAERLLPALEAANGTVAEIEALSARIAELLSGHEQVMDMARDFERTIDNAYNDGKRDLAWKLAMYQQHFGTDDLLKGLHVSRRGPLHKLVQLPAVTRLQPYWGNIYGTSEESLTEWSQRMDRESLAATGGTPEERVGPQVTSTPLHGKRNITVTGGID